MSTKTKTKGTTTKKENLAALALPALWERFKEATGESSKSPNKKFLVRRIEAALAARASEPEPEQATPSPAKRNARASEPTAETMEPVTITDSAPSKQRGRFAAMTIEELQTKYLDVVGRSTGSDDRRYLIWKIREAEKAGRFANNPRANVRDIATVAAECGVITAAEAEVMRRRNHLRDIVVRVDDFPFDYNVATANKPAQSRLAA